MSQEDVTGFTDPGELTPEEQERLVENTFDALQILTPMLTEVTGHLRETGAQCPRLCIGITGEFIAKELDEQETTTLLFLAIRLLCERLLNEQQLVANQ